MPTDGSDDVIRVDLTPREAMGLRMAIRWGCPDPTPPEVVSAVQKIGDTELEAKGRA